MNSYSKLSVSQRVLSLLFMLVMTEMAAPPAAQQPQPTTRPQQPPIFVQDVALRESSGLGVSCRCSDRYWSHNDSGDGPRLFAFDAEGKSTGRCSLAGIQANDWEDIACFDDGGPKVLVADCGDNLHNRSHVDLYLFDEPDPNRVMELSEFQTIRVKYDDGPKNCEAVAVDVARRKIILIAKTALPLAGIYTIDLPTTQHAAADLDSGTKKLDVIAKRIGTLAVPMITAMDIHASSGVIWVANYFQAYQFKCPQRDEPLAKQLAKTPHAFALPRWRQIEALAVDDQHTVWVTGEASPTPFGQVQTNN